MPLSAPGLRHGDAAVVLCVHVGCRWAGGAVATTVHAASSLKLVPHPFVIPVAQMRPPNGLIEFKGVGVCPAGCSVRPGAGTEAKRRSLGAEESVIVSYAVSLLILCTTDPTPIKDEDHCGTGGRSRLLPGFGCFHVPLRP